MGYSREVKEAIIKKALQRGDQSLKAFAEAQQVGFSTLQAWLQQIKTPPFYAKAVVRHKHVSRSERLEHLLATAGLDPEATGVYCREKGLYSLELPQWKEEFMQDNPSNNPSEDKALLKALKAENQELKRELHRKNSALAEAAALLVLKKKADSLWGERGDALSL